MEAWFTEDPQSPNPRDSALQYRNFLFFQQAFFELVRDSRVNKGSGHIDILCGQLLSVLFGCGSAALCYTLLQPRGGGVRQPFDSTSPLRGSERLWLCLPTHGWLAVG